MQDTEDSLEMLIGRLQKTLNLVQLNAKEYWTARDVATYLGLTVRQAHRLIAGLPSGSLPNSRTKIIRRDDFLRLIKQSQIRTSQHHGGDPKVSIQTNDGGAR